MSLNDPKLLCRQGLNIWIAAEFAWKPHSPASLDQIVDIGGLDGTRRDPHLIQQFDIEMTLAKRRIARMRRPERQGWRMNESVLTDEAFRPKTYTVRLEKGNFLAPFDAIGQREDQYTPRFALRLAFDPSPYPPRHEWKEPGGAPDALEMWQWKEFCGRSSPELKTQGDRHTLWGNCVVC